MVMRQQMAQNAEKIRFDLSDFKLLYFIPALFSGAIEISAWKADKDQRLSMVVGGNGQSGQNVLAHAVLGYLIK